MGLASKKSKKRVRSTLDENIKVKRTKKVVSDVDYISDLPDPLLHLILSRLHPKDAARTCILSKRWVHTLNTYQTLDFDLRRFHKMKKGAKVNYKNMMNQLLKCRKEQSLNIYKFRLRFATAEELLPDVADWITAVLESNVRELEIQAKTIKARQFCLPLSVLNGTSITALNLYGCILPTSDLNVNLPHLRKLSLKRMNIPVKFIQAVFSNCPLIDEIKLIGCIGFKSLNIGADNRLKRCDIHKCNGLRSIVIANPRLESFWCFCDKKKLCKINLSACVGLKDLVLEYPRMTDETFIDTTDFPLLEKLVLSRCYGLKNFKVSGVKLKKLVIRRCRKLVEVQVEAPNLASLEYHGDKMPFSFLKPLILKEALFYFETPSVGKPDWKDDEANRLHAFFGNLNHLTNLKLLTWTKQEAIIYEDIRAMFRPLEHLKKSYVCKLSACSSDLLSEVLKAWPYPSSLSVKSHENSEFPEAIYKELNQGKEEPNCCAYFKNKCWRHCLKSVSCEKWLSKSNDRLESPDYVAYQKTVLSLDWNTDRPGRKKGETSNILNSKTAMTETA